MAIKIQGEYKTFKYYEGLCSAGDFPREIAKVLSLGVRNKDELDETGAIISEGVVLQNKNWDIVYPLPDATLGIDLDNLTPTTFRQKILNQVGKITDTVILKTRTTPRQLTDLIGSLCDLTSGSGDKGTPIVLIQGYFDNYTNN